MFLFLTVNLSHFLIYLFYFLLPAVVAVQGGNAARSHWSLPLRRHGPDRSPGAAARRSCWRVKPPRSHEETGNEREPSPGGRVSPRTKQSPSTAESESLVRHSTAQQWTFMKRILKYISVSSGTTLIFVFCDFMPCVHEWRGFVSILKSVQYKIRYKGNCYLAFYRAVYVTVLLVDFSQTVAGKCWKGQLYI